MTEVAVPGRGVAAERGWDSGGATNIAALADWAGVSWVRGGAAIEIEATRR